MDGSGFTGSFNNNQLPAPRASNNQFDMAGNVDEASTANMLTRPTRQQLHQAHRSRNDRATFACNPAMLQADQDDEDAEDGSPSASGAYRQSHMPNYNGPAYQPPSHTQAMFQGQPYFQNPPARQLPPHTSTTNSSHRLAGNGLTRPSANNQAPSSNSIAASGLISNAFSHAATNGFHVSHTPQTGSQPNFSAPTVPAMAAANGQMILTHAAQPLQQATNINAAPAFPPIPAMFTANNVVNNGPIFYNTAPAWPPLPSANNAPPPINSLVFNNGPIFNNGPVFNHAHIHAPIANNSLIFNPAPTATNNNNMLTFGPVAPIAALPNPAAVFPAHNPAVLAALQIPPYVRPVTHQTTGGIVRVGYRVDLNDGNSVNARARFPPNVLMSLPGALMARPHSTQTPELMLRGISNGWNVRLMAATSLLRCGITDPAAIKRRTDVLRQHIEEGGRQLFPHVAQWSPSANPNDVQPTNNYIPSTYAPRANVANNLETRTLHDIGVGWLNFQAPEDCDDLTHAVLYARQVGNTTWTTADVQWLARARGWTLHPDTSTAQLDQRSRVRMIARLSAAGVNTRNM
ncbi:hypothetical protein LTR56_023320 [Elasticomyces elasticus]|nr:hypothetical protein LTR56_023320 [Elasticomyces elasticus]KAK3629841.1 hypothetical protein LTR22_021734 [Elasticomyces elasticus]KAK4908836.1 hypothetical protein LTR49_022340 [Elasticomyces elasticus]KAK5743911.1 hypothetical protein LTS12_023675 [Elasticomyces elasticus]